MSKNTLHAVLAVESDLSTQAKNIQDEAVTTFVKKSEFFDGLQKVYLPFNEGPGVEQIAPEQKQVVTTVKEKLDYTRESFVKALDATLTKEETNASGAAMAPLVVNGKTFGTFSAIGYLAMEKALVRLRDMYKAIPTLDPTTKWEVESQTGRKLYVSPAETKFRTVKQAKVVTLSPPTDKHPAQVQLVQDEVQVGKYETVYFSGRLSSAEKSELLAKIDDLILAVKKAKEEANQVEAKQVKLGEILLSYINE